MIDILRTCPAGRAQNAADRLPIYPEFICMQISRACNLADDNHPLFLTVRRSFLPKNRRGRVLHCTFALHATVFHRTINLLPTTFRPRMTAATNFSATGIDARAFSATLVSFNEGGTAVDLSLRLDVLAVCAVFVFVGAVLLGAF